jgi:hypothetical protein
VSDAPWWRHLRGDPSRFLLDDDEPGCVWVTLFELLERPCDSPAVVRAREASRREGMAARLFDSQEEGGYWGSPYAYGARWQGSAWVLAALAALGADPADPRATRGAEALLEVLYPRGGGFSSGRGRPPAACFTAEVCTALVRFGFGHHARVREAVGWLIQRDGGVGGWSCPELRHLIDGACPVAAVGALRLAASMPERERRQVETLSQRAALWLEDRRLFCADRAPNGWQLFGHPNLGRTDLLDALYGLARIGWTAGPEIAFGLARIVGLQDEGGTWLQRRRCAYGEPAGAPSRWLTLKALVALAAFGDELGCVEERT